MPSINADQASAKTLLASVVKVELPKMGGAVVNGIEQEVAEYRADPTGRVHEEVRRGVGVAVRTFVEALGGQDPAKDDTFHDVFRRIGRLEAQAGRSHDTLQAAYRSAERQILSWMMGRSTELGIDASVRQIIESQVGSFIDKLAKLSAEGYAEAQSQQEGEAKLRNQLIALLLRESVTRRSIDDAAAAISWRVPNAVRMIEFVPDSPLTTAMLEARAGLTSENGVVGHHGTRIIGVVDAAADLVNLRNTLPDQISMVVGPTVPIMDSRISARIACRAMRDPKYREAGQTICDDKLLDLLGGAANDVLYVLSVGRLQPLAHLSIEKRVKLARLLSAWLEHGTLHADVPGVLDKSRHTLRYQIAQLDSLFGESLQVREDRVQLILALRAALPQWESELGATRRRRGATSSDSAT